MDKKILQKIPDLNGVNDQNSENKDPKNQKCSLHFMQDYDNVNRRK